MTRFDRLVRLHRRVWELARLAGRRLDYDAANRALARLSALDDALDSLIT